MNNMISAAAGFQYSVNIGYDLNEDIKLKNFIPTKSSLDLLEDILKSTSVNSTERARILIGAYGKGKSHIVLTILSMLLKKDPALFEKTMPKIQENPSLSQYVQNYYESDNKILPIIISGSNTSLTQAFLIALQRTLSEHELIDVMPETNYKAAVTVINRWEKEFPDTFHAFITAVGKPADIFIDELLDYNISTYEKFESVYPTLTAGSKFNPFLGFDVVELYENVAKGLRSKGYSGIYVVYDEFSKYLEANITEASVSDTKMLQDFAEKCNRSGNLQMHIMLISHKEISNYIDKLPKQKVDGWRGVSERFKHIHLNNNFSQTYEIITSVIQKDKKLWKEFTVKHDKDLTGLKNFYEKHPLFDGNKTELEMAVYGCYPLHPVSTFILPRLSERIAQNERTLFTFLSSEGDSTLPAFLHENTRNDFKLITPDLIYDYFEPLLRKEVYGGEIHEIHFLTNTIIAHLDTNSLEAKIVKTIALIYILAQFERLKPTKDEIVGIYSSAYSASQISSAIDKLIEEEMVIYLKRSNDYLKLKQTSGIDIWQKINDTAESHSRRISMKDILNNANYNRFMYPSRYNDEHEMTRYFAFLFIHANEVNANIDWNIKSESVLADGIIYAVIPDNAESIPELQNSLLQSSNNCKRHIFILPKQYEEIEKTIREYEAVSYLRASSVDDPILYEEYDVIYDDLSEIIERYISTYSHPEQYRASYIFDGTVKNIHRKAALSELMSQICDVVYKNTPVINNEAVNRNVITSIANNSRSKIIASLLRNQLEPKLGLTGTGQEVSIMRSTLIRTGILKEENGIVSLNMHPEDSRTANMLNTIREFILGAHTEGGVSFDLLYDKLINPNNHIGLRKGLIPIYLAVVLHEYRRQVVIQDSYGQTSLNADVLQQINANPSAFTLSYLDWNPDKEILVERIADIFSEYIVPEERQVSSYDYVITAMKRWMMALPKYAKECTKKPNGDAIGKRRIKFLSLLKQNKNNFELLFDLMPKAFHYDDIDEELANDIASAKETYDNLLSELKLHLISEVKKIFMLQKNSSMADRMSLVSVLKEWCETLNPAVFEQLFPDGTDKCLALINSATNDEDTFIVRLSKALTGLRIEDWDANMQNLFITRLNQCKKTAEDFHIHIVTEKIPEVNSYQLTYAEDNGNSVTKRFDRVEITKRGKLLHNQITHDLDAMGHAISEQEKRQILMDILKNLC